jgi:hypothetical protein
VPASFLARAARRKPLWKDRGERVSLFHQRALSPVTNAAPSHKLTDILRALPQRELDGLISRLGIRIDPAKRIDVPSQVARALVSLPELRDPSRPRPAAACTWPRCRRPSSRSSRAGSCTRAPPARASS